MGYGENEVEVGGHCDSKRCVLFFPWGLPFYRVERVGMFVRKNGGYVILGWVPILLETWGRGILWVSHGRGDPILSTEPVMFPPIAWAGNRGGWQHLERGPLIDFT